LRKKTGFENDEEAAEAGEEQHADDDARAAEVPTLAEDD
jgi:hypothetical protein